MRIGVPPSTNLPQAGKGRTNSSGSTPIGKRQTFIPDALLPPFLCHCPVSVGFCHSLPYPLHETHVSHSHCSMTVSPVPGELGHVPE